MNRRENYLNTLLGKPHDYMPANFVIDGFHIPSLLPIGFDRNVIPEFADIYEIAELNKYLGLDAHVRIVPSCVKEHYANVERRTETEDGIHKRYVIELPKGQLIYQGVFAPETEFQSEYAVKSEQDYQLLIDYYNAQSLTLDYEKRTKTEQFLTWLGDGGTAYECIPSTPIMDIIRSWTGLERFIYDLNDEEELVQELLDTMERVYLEKAELIAKNSPCKVLVFWDDANSLYLSPTYFEKYCVPVMRKYSDIAHKYGKILVCHTCGSIRDFSRQFLDTGVDAVDWVSPVPVGDVNPAELQKIWSSHITMMLATAPTVFINGTAADVKSYIRELLQAVERSERLVFMLAAPTVTPIDRILAASDCLIREFGVPVNRSGKYGSILDNS